MRHDMPAPLAPPAELQIGPGAGHERLEPLQVTIAEAARLLAFDARTVRRLIARGELAAVGKGRMRRW
jgi:excisionase family DNA binding protein